jgi:hypothetical protein
MHKNFFDDWNLNVSYYFFDHFLCQLNHMIVDLFNLLDLLLHHYLLTNNLHFSYLSYDVVDLLYHLHHLRYLFYSFHILNDWNYLLHDLLYNIVFNLYVVLHFSCVSVLHHWHYLFNHLFHFNYFWNLNTFFDYFFYEDRNFNNSLNNLFHRYNFLMNYLDLLILHLHMIDHSLDLHNSIHFNYIISKNLYLNQFWYFFLQFNYLLHDRWHFNDGLNFTFNRNNAIYFMGYNHWSFKRYINDFLHFFYLFHFHNLFNNSLNCNNFWNFNYSFDNLLNDFLDLDYFGDNFINFKNIFNIHNMQYLCFNHCKKTFIYCECDTR